jgi:hypothetical protein
LSGDNHFHTNSHCESDIESTKKDQFVLVTNADNSDVPSGKCAIKFVYDNTFWKVTDKVVGDSGSSLTQSAYHFVVTSIGNGKVNIVSATNNKYLNLDGHHAKATGTVVNCGDGCKFTVEEIVSAPVYDPPESSGTLFKGILHK